MSRILGIPDYYFAVLPHPLGSLTPAEVKDRARVALPQVIEIFLGT